MHSVSPGPLPQKSLVELIDDHILYEHNSFDLQELVDNLPEETEEAAGYFCDRFELGNWFYEALIHSEIDISAELINIGARRQLEEKEASRDRAEHDRDYRRSQGYPC